MHGTDFTRPLSKNQKLALSYGIGADFGKNIIEKINYNEITFDKKYYVYNFPRILYFFRFFKLNKKCCILLFKT